MKGVWEKEFREGIPYATMWDAYLAACEKREARIRELEEGIDNISLQLYKGEITVQLAILKMNALVEKGGDK